MIPRMLDIHGKNTPFIVPNVRLSDDDRGGDWVSLDDVDVEEKTLTGRP